nr:RNA polymerase subunit sigma [Bifidobacterium longum]
MRTARPVGGTGVRVTEGVRKIIVEWHGKGVPPEETARSLRIPIDEVKAIILQAHPAPAPEKPAGIGDNRRES